MKKLLYTLTLVSIAFGAIANHRNSDLHIQMFNGALIKVFIDGRLVSYQAQPTVCMNDVIPGRHSLRVVAPQTGFHGFQTGFERTLFQGNVFVEEAAEIHGEVDRFGRFRVTRVAQRHFNDHSPGGWGNDNDVNYYDNDRRGNYNGWTNGHGGGYGRAIISERELQDIRQQLRNASFESTKLAIAKRAINGRFVSAAQVREIMDGFTFESTKVDFAKFAFPMVVDKERFYMVYDAFTFSSSIDELDAFISRQGY